VSHFWGEHQCLISAKQFCTSQFAMFLNSSHPDTGLVMNVYDVSGLYPNRGPGAGPLTGIALTNVPGEVWVTGKNWPKSYHIRLFG
jgi:glutamine cyclotransferase